MNLHFPAFFWVDDKPSFDVFHVENGFAEDLGAQFLVFGDVEDFVDGLFALLVGKVDDPVVEAAFFELAELSLDPQVGLFVSTVLVELGFVEGEKVVVVLGVEAGRFQTND